MLKGSQLPICSQGRLLLGGIIWAETWKVRRSQPSADVSGYIPGQGDNKAKILTREETGNSQAARRLRWLKLREQGCGGELGRASSCGNHALRWLNPGETWGGRVREGYDMFLWGLTLNVHVDLPRKCPVKKLKWVFSTVPAPVWGS